MLLGAGASISSGIMSGGQMVWDFKRKIYCIENKISEAAFQDMSKETAQREIQVYLDAKGEHPRLYSTEEYSHYFEYLFGNSRDRDLYIQSKVKNATPYLGYLCLGALIIEGRINFLSTTNFDDLIKAGAYAIDAGHSIKIISSAIENSVGFNLNDGLPTILKLHGDYLVDHLKNTSEELRVLENSINLKLQDVLRERGLIVVGYAGNDNSVMTVLEEIVNQNGLPYGIIWCKPKNSVLSARAKKFMEFACSKNEQSGIVDIDSFDDLMYRLYLTMGKSYKEIDERWKDPDYIKPILFGGLKKRNVFTKTNTFETIEYPEKSYAFETTITSWKELRNYLNNSDRIVAALFKGKVWAFGDKVEVQKTFEKVLKSDIEMQKFPEDWIQKDYSFVWSMYYDLIKLTLISKGLMCFGKNKFFDPNVSIKENGNIIYDAVEVFLSCVGRKILLTILPTFYIEKDNRKPMDRLHKQKVINFHISKLYNPDVSQRINDWTKRLCFNKELAFRIAGFVLELNKIVYTSGGVGRKESWPEIQCFQCEEPKMCFSVDDASKVAVNQLKGLVNYGPIERLKNGSSLDSIKLAVLTPDQTHQEVITHLEKLKQQYVSKFETGTVFFTRILGI